MARNYRGPIVDCDLHHIWKTPNDVLQYLPKEWQEYANGEAPRGARNGTAGSNFPEGNRRHDSFRVEGEPPCSDYEFTREQLFDRHNFWRIVAAFDVGGHGNQQNPYFGTAYARAVNDWNADTWLTYDERIYGVVGINMAQPDEAAAEIRRVGQHPRVCATVLAGSPLGRPYGDPIYDPIWKAAAELGLPVDIHFGTAAAERQAGGIPESDLASIVPMWATMMHHVTSLIVNGVFEKWPTMRVLIKEVGTMWLPQLMWRLDESYESLKRESQWVKKLPSEYMREHIKLGTQPLEEVPNADDLKSFFEVNEMDDILCFASDYAHTTFDDPDNIARRLPDGWARRVMCDNSCEHYGWTPPVPDPALEPEHAGAAA
jgi:predicted TIM-barrel fold metal-dependent hydrolase